MSVFKSVVQMHGGDEARSVVEKALEHEREAYQRHQLDEQRRAESESRQAKQDALFRSGSRLLRDNVMPSFMKFAADARDLGYWASAGYRGGAARIFLVPVLGSNAVLQPNRNKEIFTRCAIAISTGCNRFQHEDTDKVTVASSEMGLCSVEYTDRAEGANDEDAEDVDEDDNSFKRYYGFPDGEPVDVVLYRQPRQRALCRLAKSDGTLDLYEKEAIDRVLGTHLESSLKYARNMGWAAESVRCDLTIQERFKRYLASKYGW